MKLIISMRHKPLIAFPAIVLNKVILFLKDNMAFRKTNIVVCYEGNLKNTNLDYGKMNSKESAFYDSNLNLLESIRALKQIHPNTKVFLTHVSNTYSKEVTPQSNTPAALDRQTKVTAALIEALNHNTHTIILNYGDILDTIVEENSPICMTGYGYSFNVHYLPANYPFEENYLLRMTNQNTVSENEVTNHVKGVLASFLQKSILTELQEKLVLNPIVSGISTTSVQQSIYYNAKTVPTTKPSEKITKKLDSNAKL